MFGFDNDLAQLEAQFGLHDAWVAGFEFEPFGLKRVKPSESLKFQLANPDHSTSPLSGP
jgi:hypothetical protein